MKELINAIGKKSLAIILTVYWLIIFIGTSLPGNSLHYISGFSDKFKHTVAYMGLTFLLYWLLYLKNKKNDLTRKQLARLIILISAYGIIDELHQLFIPGRSCDIRDWFADILGLFFGILIAKFWFVKKVVKS